MTAKAKILAILLVFCLLAAVYAPAVSAGGGNHPGGPPIGGGTMWRWMQGAIHPIDPPVDADDNKVDVGKNVTGVPTGCLKQERGKQRK